MTKWDELKKAAEAATPPDEWRLARLYASPSTIISLIEENKRLREAIIRAEEHAANVCLGVAVKADVGGAIRELSDILITARSALSDQPKGE